MTQALKSLAVHATACALVLAAALATPARAADLTLRIEGASSASGKLMVAVFDDAKEFPRGKFKTAQVAPAATGAVTLVFKDLAPGRYALSAYHDANGNQKLDANMVGLPTEAYGFSRDARGSFGPPAFDEAAITLGDQPLQLSIHLK